MLFKMQGNPMLNPKPQMEKKKYPISVHFVYPGKFDMNDPVIRKLREFCQELNIDFMCREFDSYVYREDRDYIEKLPALQLYEKGKWEETFYPYARPIQIILESYKKFQKLEKEKLEAKERWNQKIKNLKRILTLKTDSKVPPTILY